MSNAFVPSRPFGVAFSERRYAESRLSPGRIPFGDLSIGAGDAVRSLSLAERKALFEVGVHEHVSALTELLFPEEDGVSPRVNIDVSV